MSLLIAADLAAFAVASGVGFRLAGTFAVLVAGVAGAVLVAVGAASQTFVLVLAIRAAAVGAADWQSVAAACAVVAFARGGVVAS